MIFGLAGAGVVDGFGIQSGGNIAPLGHVHVLLHVGDGEAWPSGDLGGKGGGFRLLLLIGDEAVGDAQAIGFLAPDLTAGKVELAGATGAD